MRMTLKSPTMSRNMPNQKKMVLQLQMRPWFTALVTDRARRTKYEMCALLARARSSVDSVSLGSRLGERRVMLTAPNSPTQPQALGVAGASKVRDLEPNTDLQFLEINKHEY